MAQPVTYLPDVVSMPIPDEELRGLVEKAKDWALMHGVAMRSRTQFSEDALQFAPFVLIPSAFPRLEFQRAVELQTVLNELMHRVAHNRAFLTESLKDTIKVDEFTANLFKIYEIVQNEGVTQPISLGLVRSDYMVNFSTASVIKQVEFNTIATSFGGLSKPLASINRYILQELGHDDKLVNLPENNALQGLCGGMIEAWKLYGKPKAVVLFVVENVTFNICDQRFHEFELRKMSPSTRVIRRTLTDIGVRAQLGENKQLLIDDFEVAVVYFRSGYEPDQYLSQIEWDARLLMERSKAIKCPSIHYHLAGTKKVQQTLAKSGALELFLKETSKVEAVKEIFTGLYSLDFDEMGDQAVQMAIDEPEKFVLKPQREGGGNNIYGVDIREAILKMKDDKERMGWILMERILPPYSKGYIVRPGGPAVPDLVDLISELGIYGVVIGDSQKITFNKQAGHVLRTKVSTSNEGGVSAGLGALDSPYLID